MISVLKKMFSLMVTGVGLSIAFTTNVMAGTQIPPALSSGWYSFIYPNYTKNEVDFSGGAEGGLFQFIHGDAQTFVYAGGHPSGGVSVMVADDLSSPSGISARQVAAAAELKYYIEVNGPTNSLVSIDMTGALITMGSESVDSLTVGAYAQIQIRDNNNYYLNAIANYGSSPISYPTDVIFNNFTFVVPTNTPILVQLDASVVINPWYRFDQASATADPVFTINPLTQNAGNYSIILSDGIGNTNNVPEPSSTVLLSTGLLGFFASQRKNNQSKKH